MNVKRVQYAVMCGRARMRECVNTHTRALNRNHLPMGNTVYECVYCILCFFTLVCLPNQDVCSFIIINILCECFFFSNYKQYCPHNLYLIESAVQPKCACTNIADLENPKKKTISIDTCMCSSLRETWISSAVSDMIIA